MTYPEVQQGAYYRQQEKRSRTDYSYVTLQPIRKRLITPRQSKTKTADNRNMTFEIQRNVMKC